MRTILKILAWIFALGAVIRAALSLYTAWLAATLDNVGWDISVESLITDHVAVLGQLPDLARNILPDHLVETILGAPALIATPIGAAVAAALSWLFFRMSR